VSGITRKGESQQPGFRDAGTHGTFASAWCGG
jgi:hypothetical protein